MKDSGKKMADRLALRPKEAAASLGIGEKTLRKWMKDEGLPFLRLDGVVLIPRGDLERWMEGRVGSERRTETIVDEILHAF